MSESLKGNFRSVSLFLASQALAVADPMASRKYWFWRANVYVIVPLHSICIWGFAITSSIDVHSHSCGWLSEIREVICVYVMLRLDKKREPGIKEAHALHKHASQMRSNVFTAKERFARGHRSCLKRGQCMCKCHYLAGSYDYCAHRGWGLLAA